MSGTPITREAMYARTMDFSVRVHRLVCSMPKGISEDVMARQIFRSATSIGANYREACHAKSQADFAAKLKICEGEADETLYWLQLLVNTGTISEAKLQPLLTETKELVAILTASTKKAYLNLK